LRDSPNDAHPPLGTGRGAGEARNGGCGSRRLGAALPPRVISSFGTKRHGRERLVALNKGSSRRLADAPHIFSGAAGLADPDGCRSMEFTTVQEFPARLDELWVAFGHPQYPRQKYLALGATAVRIRRFVAKQRSIEVELERSVPLDRSRFAAWARKLLGSEQTLLHRSAWRRVGATRIAAELDISPVGLPVHAHGVGAIVEMPSATTRMELTWRVDSSLPLVGGKVERLFAEQVRTALDDDHRFTVRYLQSAAPRRSPTKAKRPAGAR